MENNQVIKTFECSNPQMDVLETTAQRILMHCGVGSGKSFDIGILAGDFAAKNPEVRGFIGANTVKQLSDSTLDRVFSVWETIFGWKKNIHYVVDRKPPSNFIVIGPELKEYYNTISFNNGALIFVNSLENYSAIDGKEFGWALLDETKDTREVAVKEVIIARLRQLGMMIDVRGKIYSTLKWDKEKELLIDLLKVKVDSGLWRHDKAKNEYFDQNGDRVDGYTPLYIFTSPAKSKWIMDWFKLDDDAHEIEKSIYSETDYYRKFNKKRSQLVVVASTYHNRANLSPGYIERMIDDVGGDEGRVAMLIYGSPFGKTGGEYYTGYKRLEHVQKFEPWEDEPVHISFDFNSNPYMTATLWQMKHNQLTGRYLVRAFAEFCLPNPKNTTPDLCEEIINEYGELCKRNGVFIYGDYSGKKQQTITRDFKHEYEVIENFFRGWGYMETSYRVIVNPRHKKRRPFMNKLLRGKHPVDIEINECCKELRADFEFVKEGKNGDKHKEEVTNEETGVSYQEHGHTSDTADYFLCSVFNDLFNK